ncbi:MFS transporter [Stenotrophomonas geniculata]
MVDLGLLASPRFVGALIAMVGYSVSAQVMASMLPQYLQNGIGLGVLAAGAGMLPFAAAMLLFPSVGRRLGRHLNSPAVLAIGLSITAAGNAVAGLAAWQHLPWLAFVAMVVIGAGGGILNGETSKAIIGAAPRERAGMASGISATTRFVGILLGFTVLSSALTLGIRNALSAVVPARDVLSMADAIATGTFTGARNMAFAQAIYSHGFASALWTSAIAALLASLAVLLLGRSPAQR